MEAKCQTCGNFFDKSKIVVTYEGFYCEGCLPDNTVRAFFTLKISWTGVNALMEFLNGSVDLDVLETVEVLNQSLKKVILKQLGELSKGGEFRESDSKSVESGDGER